MTNNVVKTFKCDGEDYEIRLIEKSDSYIFAVYSDDNPIGFAFIIEKDTAREMNKRISTEEMLTKLTDPDKLVDMFKPAIEIRNELNR